MSTSDSPNSIPTPRSRRSARRVVPAIVVTGAVGIGALGYAIASAESPVPARSVAAAAPQTAGRQAPSAVTLRTQMRTLWTDHVLWTRLYIVSALADLPDLGATTQRLLQNQTDIGDAFSGFYGTEAGATLTGLLREHILIAADLLTAAKAGDSGALAGLQQRWQANADQIGAFLASQNPRWSATDMSQMMQMHLEQTLAEATARLTGDWSADVAAYDHIQAHMLELADTLSTGIIAQFPAQFTR